MPIPTASFGRVKPMRADTVFSELAGGTSELTGWFISLQTGRFLLGK
jgi:hypothetical protein